MSDSLPARWRVVLRGLAAGAVYSLTRWICLRHLLNATIYSVSPVLFYSAPAVCVVLCCFILLFRSEKPGRSYLIALFSSLAVHVFFFFLESRSAVVSFLLYGAGGNRDIGVLHVLVIEYMFAAKGLTGLFLLVFGLISGRRQKQETDGDDTGPADM